MKCFYIFFWDGCLFDGKMVVVFNRFLWYMILIICDICICVIIVLKVFVEIKKEEEVYWLFFVLWRYRLFVCNRWEYFLFCLVVVFVYNSLGVVVFCFCISKLFWKLSFKFNIVIIIGLCLVFWCIISYGLIIIIIFSVVLVIWSGYCVGNFSCCNGV